MRIVAEPIKSGELEPGDLFSLRGPDYWDHIDRNLKAVGEKVYIRTENPPPPGDDDTLVYKITIVKDAPKFGVSLSGIKGR